VAVVGIGQALRGDDEAGCAVARGLLARSQTPEAVLILEAGAAPENVTGLLRRHRPRLVVLVDAAEMQAAPGTIGWLPWQDTLGPGFSTHAVPPHLLARYLTTELGCEVCLLGLQPASTVLGARLSAPAARAVEQAVNGLAAVLSVAAPQAAAPTTPVA
jgi:hydrogenase 3 maturation protease